MEAKQAAPQSVMSCCFIFILAIICIYVAIVVEFSASFLQFYKIIKFEL